MRRARGFIGFPVVMIIVIASLAYPLYVVHRHWGVAETTLAQEPQRLDDARERLLSWYERQASSPAAVADMRLPASPAPVLGLAERADWQFAMSDVLWDGALPYRRLVVWQALRPEPQSPFDRRTGTFTTHADNPFRVIDGRAVQMRAVARTEERLKALANALQRWAQAQFLLDPLRDLHWNHFRPRERCAPRGPELPCIDDFERIDRTSLPYLLGWDPGLLVTAWQTPIEVSNGRGARHQEPPYTIALRATTPWGTTIEAVAVQPIN
jgi:hypothetical protein